jgi:hypothetical protein
MQFMNKSLLKIYILIFMLADISCYKNQKELPNRERVDNKQVIGWLQKMKSTRDIDNHHLEQNKILHESSFVQWIEEGRKINNISILLSDILNEKNTHVDLSLVAFALGYLGNKESASALIDSLKSDDPYVKIEASLALGRLCISNSIHILCEISRKDDNPSVRANALIALGNFDTPEVRACVESALDDQDDFVKDVAHDIYQKLK